MSNKRSANAKLARRYEVALKAYVDQGTSASLAAAEGLGGQAVACGLETLDLARIHDRALATLHPAATRRPRKQRAEKFFAEATIPIEKTHSAALDADTRVNNLHKKLARRTVELAASDKFLKQGIRRRKSVEEGVKKSAGNHARLVKKSRHLHQDVRRLISRLLLAREAHRTKLGRELQDEVAQTLLGINIRLFTLKKEALATTEALQKEIAGTRGLVDKSAKTISRFTREHRKQKGR